MDRGPLRRFLGWSLLLLGLCHPVPGLAEEGIDDIFSDPEAGIIEQPVEGLDIEALTADKKPRFSGSAAVSGGLVLGYNDWGQPLTEPGAIAAVPFYLIESFLKLDVRPASFLRLFANFRVTSPYADPASPPDTAIDFSPVLVEELFLDYTLKDRIFFRAGKQEITWGQGRLFNPGDFLSQASDGISVKGFLPLGPNGLTVVGLGQGVLSSASEISELIAVAGLFETSLASLTFGLSAYYRLTPGLKTGAYFKTPVAGVDVVLEGLLNWNPEVSSLDSAVVLAGLFWEGGRHKWQMILEYLFDSWVPDYLGHSLGLGVIIRNWLPGGWRPGLRWVHSFADVSGQLLVGLDGPIAPFLRLAIGFPFRYGDPNGHYRRYLVSQLTGVGFLEHFEDGQIPGNPAAAVLLMLTLSVDF